MMAALNDLFKWGFWLPRKTFDFLGACWFSTFTKLFSKEVKVTLLWWNLDNSSDLKLLKLNFLQSQYIKTLGSSFSNVVLLHHWWNQMMMINCSQSPEFSLWALKTLIGDSKSEMADGKGLLDVNLWTHVHPPPITSIFLPSLPFYCQVVGATLNSGVTLNSHTFSMETHWMVSITACRKMFVTSVSHWRFLPLTRQIF